MRSGRGLLLALFCHTVLLFGQGTAAPSAQPRFGVSFTFERAIPGVAVPRYSIELREDGTGLYHAEIPEAPSPSGRSSAAPPSEIRTLERPLFFSAATVKSAIASVHLLRLSKEACASRLKNIADTGTKTLVYRDTDGDGACTYNYTENKGAIQLTELFQHIEFTLEEGRALAFKHRFDRLGLDAEIETLVSAVDAGRALELENIAPTLQSIAGDTELIERVRLRATRLLEVAQAGR